MNNTCENCTGSIDIMIRKGSGSCSLACDRALGIGKYTDRAGEPLEPIFQTKKAPKQVEKQKARIETRSEPWVCTCGHPGAGCYCR